MDAVHLREWMALGAIEHEEDLRRDLEAKARAGVEPRTMR